MFKSASDQKTSGRGRTTLKCVNVHAVDLDRILEGYAHDWRFVDLLPGKHCPQFVGKGLNAIVTLLTNGTEQLVHVPDILTLLCQ